MRLAVIEDLFDKETIVTQTVPQVTSDTINNINTPKTTILQTINKININSCSKQELMSLGGIGDKISDYIMQVRPFSSIEGLIRVNRIGSATFQNIKDHVCI